MDSHEPAHSKETNDAVKAAIESITSRFEHLERKIISTIEMRFDRFESRLFSIERRVDQVQEEITGLRTECEEKSQLVSHLSQRVDELYTLLDDREQYSRRDNIRIVGLDEKKNETIEECAALVQDFFQQELKIEDKIDISIAHRLGKPRDGQSRPIICRLVKRSHKSTIMRGRKELREKKSKIYISEDLTHTNQRLLRDLKQDQRVARAWTYNCAVNIEGHNGQRLYGVRSVAQVNNLLDRFNRR